MRLYQLYRPSISFALIALLIMGCGGSESGDLKSLARASLAQINGELTLTGLKETAEVVRDQYGIPHIYAQNVGDFFFAQGYVMAQDRLWQLEMWRRWREGRLAEIFGPEAFPYDVRTRLMMYRGPFDDTEWTSYHSDGERIFNAYANGINAFIDQNRDNLPVEFRLSGVKPGRWTAQTVVRRWTGLNFPSASYDVLNDLRLALNVAEFGVEEANRRAAPLPWDDLKIPEGLDVSNIPPEIIGAIRSGDSDPFVPGRLPGLQIVERFQSLLSGERTSEAPPMEQLLEIGSNNWAYSVRSITHPQPDSRRCGRQYRVPAFGAHAGPERLERAPARTWRREIRVAGVPQRSPAGIQPETGLGRIRQQRHASTRL